MTIAAIVLIVDKMLGFVSEPSVGVKAAATWPITSEIDGKMPPARIAASVPPTSKNLSNPVIKV